MSDHGESVYTGTGHDSSRLVHEMLRIPFLIYYSNSFIEKYENILMIPFSEKWSDVGSMHSLMQHYTKDENRNVAIGNSTIIDSENTFLNCADSDIHLVGMGLKNIMKRVKTVFSISHCILLSGGATSE